jgi:hypothetical protein
MRCSKACLIENFHDISHRKEGMQPLAKHPWALARAPVVISSSMTVSNALMMMNSVPKDVPIYRVRAGAVEYFPNELGNLRFHLSCSCQLAP